jgi:predicted Kef-type K+ transport protein
MQHDTPLIATIVAGLGLAFVFGAIAQRLRIPPLVGYLLAGVAVGPFTPGFVADQALAAELAELGVILLMFGVGLHFSLNDLLSVRAIALPGTAVQIAVATLMGLGLALFMGWTVGAGLVFGLALSVASTVVLLRAIQERRLMETERGRIAVGWLIVEDLAMVLALVLLPALASLLGASSDVRVADPLAARLGLGLAGVLLLTLIKVAVFVGIMLIVGRLATALTISASLAQIGEFSFILAELGVTLNLLPKAGRDLILAGAILSIMLNPLIFAAVDWLTPRLERRRSRVMAAPVVAAPTVQSAALAEASEPPDATRLTGHTILVGYGRVGSIIGDALKQNSQPFLVIEVADSALARLRESNVETIMGNAARSDVLKAANPASARYLVSAIPEAFEAGQIVQQARAANPEIQIIARAHSDAEVDHLTSLGADMVIMGEREIARGMIEDLLARQARISQRLK